MTIRPTPALVLCTGLLAGCCCIPPAPDKGAGVGPSGVMQCGMATTKANTCVTTGGHTVCHAHVGGTAEAPFVYPYKLHVGTVGEVTIVWHLLDRRARFVDATHGPNFGTNAEFSGGAPSDDESGATAAGGPAKHFKIKFKNTPAGQPHLYTIKFKTDAGAVVECDPTVTNQND